MNNRTFGFGQFMHYMVIVVTGFVIMQLVARLFWVLLIMFVTVVFIMPTTKIDGDRLWQLLTTYPSEFGLVVLTQVVGAVIAGLLIWRYFEYRRRSAPE